MGEKKTTRPIGKKNGREKPLLPSPPTLPLDDEGGPDALGRGKRRGGETGQLAVHLFPTPQLTRKVRGKKGAAS